MNKHPAGKPNPGMSPDERLRRAIDILARAAIRAVEQKDPSEGKISAAGTDQESPAED
jgi:hypothetical protein